MNYREESSRVYKEFEKFYSKFPQYRIQANHEIFLVAASADGGSEVLTAEWMELQLDSLRGQLAVLQETPAQQLDAFMKQHPALDCTANRRFIADHIHQNYGTVEQAVSALGNQLAFNQDVADEHAAQKQTQEREDRKDFLLNRATPEELRAVARQESEANRVYQKQQEVKTQIETREALDQQRGFPALPLENSYGEKLDSAYLNRISNVNLQLFRTLIKKYGAANVTARLRGIR
jgi:hypothetical protein